MITRSQVKYIQSLSDKKFRRECGCFVAEGPKIINEFLVNKEPALVTLYATPDWIEATHDARVPFDSSQVVPIKESELKDISFLSTPHQVLGIFQIPSTTLPHRFRHRLSLVLDGIQDPGNFGTIIRIADWYNIGCIIATPDCADAYNPKVVQATMGSIARVNIVYDNLQGVLGAQKDIPVYASALDGKSLLSFSPIDEGFLVIGNESKGISQSVLALADYLVTIPRMGKAESLNAAVAAGILLSRLAPGGRQEA